MRIEPTQELLKQLLCYDPETGVFIWHERSLNTFKTIGAGKIWNSRFSEKQAGGICKLTGYVFIGINKIQYRAHRLAWLYEYGYLPLVEMDHINMIRHDNRICNLREASHGENNQNKRKLRNNTSGYKGVCWDKQAKKWKAQIGKDNKIHGLGHFNDIKHAYFAYCKASKQLHAEFSRVSE